MVKDKIRRESGTDVPLLKRVKGEVREERWSEKCNLSAPPAPTIEIRAKIDR